MSITQKTTQTARTSRLTALLTSNFAFLSRHGVNTVECRKWLEDQTKEDRLLLESWLDRTQNLQRILKKAQTHTTL